MTPEDHVMELLERANPVPDSDDVEPPTNAGAYRRRLEHRSSTMTLTAVDPDTPDVDGRQPRWRVLAVAAAVLVVVAGLMVVNRSDDDAVPAGQPESPPATEAPEASPTLPAPSSTGAPGPVVLNAGTQLESGSSYVTPRTSTQGVPMSEPQIMFTVPGPEGEPSWSVLNLLPLESTFLPLGDWITPGVREPSFGLAPVSAGATVDDVVRSVEAAALDDDTIEVVVEEQPLRGTDVTVLRGSVTGAGNEAVRIPTSENSGFSVPPRREFVAYLIEAPEHVVAVKIESLQVDLDAAIEQVLPIIESIEFP